MNIIKELFICCCSGLVDEGVCTADVTDLCS
jgi:hypothetical protein